ncbi:hypothetical protein ACTA71_006116 [Dictyostelium dimigraforme]
MIENEIRRNNKPTLKERFFGIPSSDETSKLKFKINFINIFFVVGILFLISIYYIEDSFRNRDVKITQKAQKSINIPEIKIESQNIFQDLYPVYLESFTMDDADGNRNIYYIDMENKTNISIDDYIYYTPTSLTLYPSKNYSLQQNEHIRIWLDFVSEDGNVFNISTTVNNEVSFFTLCYDSINLGISKTVKIDQYKNEVEFYKTKMTTGLYEPFDFQQLQTNFTVGIDISYFTHIITTETTQTDLEIIIEILSSVGSLISTVVLACGIGFSIITRFFIKDKDGWIDYEVRETIVYHANQLNEDNLPTDDGDGDYNNLYMDQ